jgi:hypothetical protein
MLTQAVLREVRTGKLGCSVHNCSLHNCFCYLNMLLYFYHDMKTIPVLLEATPHSWLISLKHFEGFVVPLT